MKVAGCTLFLAVMMAVATPWLNGQQASISQGAPVSCPHLFQTGSTGSNNYIQYCVTDNGNITVVNTPYTHPQMGAGGEGYGLCQESPSIEYHDYAVDAIGWGAAHIVTLSGSTIKISRSTNDGGWTLVQTISKVGASASIKVVMALTNNQSVDKVAYLTRFADVDPDGLTGVGNVTYAAMSIESAWAWNATGAHFGLQLQNTGKVPFGYQEGFARVINTGPNACDFAGNSIPSGVVFDDHANTNSSINYSYVGSVAAHQTLTVTMSYSRM